MKTEKYNKFKSNFIQQVERDFNDKAENFLIALYLIEERNYGKTR